MTIRTSKKTVTFRSPFVVGGPDEALPAGVYEVETDEELLEGISFPAYRRILTLIHLHPKPGRPGLTETLTIDPNELDAALERDQAPTEPPTELKTNKKISDRNNGITPQHDGLSSHRSSRRRRDDSSPRVNNHPTTPATDCVVNVSSVDAMIKILSVHQKGYSHAMAE